MATKTNLKKKIRRVRPPKRISREYERATETAKYYGFCQAPYLEIEREDLIKAKTFKDSHTKEVHPFREDEFKFSGFLEEKICILRNFLEKNMAHLGIPAPIYYEGPIAGNPHIPRIKREKTFNMEILSNSKSIADAMIIETAFVILKDQYPEEELSIGINSIGDKESIARFTRELTAYYRKNWSSLPAHCRATFKKDIFEILHCREEECLALQEAAPKAMSFLSEPSRVHFKEVLEYLESLGLPYNIEHSLVGSRSFCSGTIFEIRGTNKKTKEENTYAIGERYNGLAKKIWNKKDVPSVGVAILIHPDHLKQNRRHREVAPKFYFIQFGFDAKLQSLKIMEMLRQAKIPMHQSLSKDKLTVQIGTAEKMNIPYVIIMGQKEALEGSAVVRNMSNRSQETIMIEDLVKYLKKLK
ncbi:MAG TPA: His/Gly/Thr/Pro-type tRNA ligase C-terminal domain-containing protein [Candidatus Paceibacterota bacterium]|nr:His/Gly/Thr/Pro-type tRNA ligase C-terminal domain-containing protein [Candidatus Paceibacterota bacterium]